LSKFLGAVFQQKRFDAARQLIDGVAPEFRDSGRHAALENSDD
jgi:hypothetical protein